MAAEIVYGKTEPQGQWMLKHYEKPVASKESDVVLKGGITETGDNEIDQVVFLRFSSFDMGRDFQPVY